MKTVHKVRVACLPIVFGKNVVCEKTHGIKMRALKLSSLSSINRLATQLLVTGLSDFR